MNEVFCPCGLSNLKIDFEESKHVEYQMIYCCQNCGSLYVLQKIGEKPRGWKTKSKLEEDKLIKSILF
jgi:hypothetical protein